MKIKLAHNLIEIFPGRNAPTDLIQMRVSNTERFGSEFLRRNKKPAYFTCIHIENKKTNFTAKVDDIFHYRYRFGGGIRSAFEFKVQGRYIATFWHETSQDDMQPTDCKTLDEAFKLSQKLSEALFKSNFKEIR